MGADEHLNGIKNDKNSNHALSLFICKREVELKSPDKEEHVHCSLCSSHIKYCHETKTLTTKNAHTYTQLAKRV